MANSLSRRTFVTAAAGATVAAASLLHSSGTSRAETSSPKDGAELPLPDGGHPWSGGFATLNSENDYWVEEVEGEIPGELRGTLFRNGPAKNGINGQWFAHWFDGDGMLSSITFDRRRVRYRNRFVRSEGYVQEQAAGRILYRGFGTQRPGGVLANALRMPKNAANTSVVYHSKRLLALWEGGPPTALRPEDLSTIGIEDFGGAVQAFSAHPKLDSRSGELFNFGVNYGRVCTLQIYRLDNQGKVSPFPAIELPYPVMNHDFVMTDKHLIFCLGPIVAHSTRLILGLGSFDQALEWDAKKPTRILIVSRDRSSEPKWVEMDPFFQFHFANSFEEQGAIHVDVARYPDFNSIGTFLRNFWRAPWPDSGGARMTRLTIDPATGKVTSRVLGGGNAEFPQYNHRMQGGDYRYLYLAALPSVPQAGFFQVINKVDLKNNTVATHDFSPDGYVGEPVFVAKNPAANGNSAEDDGFLVTLVFDSKTRRTRVVVLDARDVAAKPVAVAHLTHHVPFGFHGFFTPQVFTSV